MAKPFKGAPAVFLDRDGTINVEKNYLHRIEDWEWIEGAPTAIRKFNRAGFKVVVVSNQSGIARGMYCCADVDNLHAFVSNELRKIGATVDAFYYCPHHPEFGEKRVCSCRKPLPGMLLGAAEELNIDLSRSWMIGDKFVDVRAAKTADVVSILVRTGYGATEARFCAYDQLIAADIATAAQIILSKCIDTELRSFGL